MDTSVYKCPSCKGDLPFNPVTQKWQCPYCGQSWTLKDLQQGDVETKSTTSPPLNAAPPPYSKKKPEKEIFIDSYIYHCKNCGAEMLTDETNTSSFCPYCGASGILKDRFTGSFKPGKIIPFRTSKDQAIKKFESLRRRHPLAPSDFSSKKNIEKISGIYAPFWLYSGNVDGSVVFDAEIITTWSSGNYDYTKTDKYKVYRKGNYKFIRVPADGSTKLDDDTMDSIEPFDYNDLTDFNASYISGFLSEKYDVSDDDNKNRISTRLSNSLIEYMRNTVSSYSTVNKSTVKELKKDFSDVEYVLLPVWLLNIKYKKEIRTFAMNGQTGKIVGNFPVDIKKTLVWSFGMLTVLFGVFALLAKIFF